MIDLGEKGECGIEGPSNDVYYPTIYIDNSNAGAGDKESYSFEVRKIDFMKTKEEEDYTRGRVKTKSLRS